MHSIPVALFNFEHGGLVRGIAPGLFNSRGYDFARLSRAFAPMIGAPPALIVLCQAKEWNFWSGAPGYEAAYVVSELLNRPYEIQFTWLDRGPIGPALLYDPTVLRLAALGDLHASVGQTRVALAEFALRANDSVRFQVRPAHLDFANGDRRLDEVKLLDGLGEWPIPTLLLGDLNGTASGPHLPQRDWIQASARERRQKAWQPNGPGTEWVTDTRALDYLIGHWVGKPELLRADGLGFHAVPEIAWQQGMDPARALVATSNASINTGGQLLIDWILINDAWYHIGGNGVVPGTYMVHGGSRQNSDHLLVTVTMAL